MNNYFKNLNRIEFVITYACTGRCKHCSEGEHKSTGEYIDVEKAIEVVMKVAKNYQIESLMTFGGEPLLHPEIVCPIHSAAKEMNIPKRELITNGFFSSDERKIKSVAEKLGESGVNNILVSVDAFHQETIPLEPVMSFAKEMCRLGIRARVQPAWLVSKEDNNPYNIRTKELLKIFKDEGIEENEGNIVFPSGNALKYFGEYFDLNKKHVSSYAQNPKDIHAISVNPDGRILNGNIYEDDILEIMEKYNAN